MSEYLAIKAASSGLLTTVLNDSPYMAWFQSPWNPTRQRDDSDPADLGTYSHAMLLEGGLSALVVVDADDWRTKAAREARDAARAEGKTPILAKKIQAVERMAETARAYVDASALHGVFEAGHAENTMVWQENGVDCKARPDWLNLGMGVNLSYKTTAGSANPRQWIRAQLPQYELGMALYERGVKAVHGHVVKTIHLVQSQSAPYACSLVALDPARQDFAERQLDTALAIWKRCLDERKFPSYPLEICYAEPVNYLQAAFEQQYSEQEITDVMEELAK